MLRKIAPLLAVLVFAGSAAYAQSPAEGEPSRTLGVHDERVTPLSPESFGPNVQFMTIGAAAFQPVIDATHGYAGYGYIYRTGGNNGAFWAPVNLPNGAVVEHVCVQVYDTSVSNVSVDWGLYELGSQLAPPSYVQISAGTDNWSAGYHIFCIPDVEYPIHSLFDYDGDGNANFGAYRIEVYLNTTDDTLQLGGAWIRYRLPVSPPPAAATYSDVPTDHPFFQFVEALGASGITAGYPDGRFGVDDPITRGQMAVFLAKALGLHWSF